jgi:hypothetical protein
MTRNFLITVLSNQGSSTSTNKMINSIIQKHETRRKTKQIGNGGKNFRKKHTDSYTVLTYESVSLVASVKARRSLLRLFCESV